jgi:hypothetical protein
VTPHEHATRIAREVTDELTRACVSFDPMASPHEGYAVILEELDELWQHVKANTGRSAAARDEAIQIAAMAMRYVLDVTPPFEHLTHGRHCSCSACAREDWARPELAACGMHGPLCPPVYAPLGAPGDRVEVPAR